MHMNKYFGTDGIRGLVGESVINIDFAFRLGFAAGTVFIDKYAHNNNKSVVIVRDTRVSSCMLESALQAGFLLSGIDVFVADSQAMPTSSAAFLVRYFNSLAGVVVSASHNKYNYNGFKFFSYNGFKISEEVESCIEKNIDRNIDYSTVKFGQLKSFKDLDRKYIDFCKESFPSELNLKGLKIVVDAANGSAYKVAPSIFRSLGAEVYALGDKPDGFNINESIGSLRKDLLLKEVKRNNANLAIILDGDGDRIEIMDSNGVRFNGDELLYIIIKDRLLLNKVKGVVGTHMTNYGFELQMRKIGVDFCRVNVGDRFVSEELNKRGWLYGGENSGHLLCLDCHTTGDGIIAGLQVLAAIVRSGCNISELLKDLNMYSQRIINVPWNTKDEWEENTALKSTADNIESFLSGRGRVLIRKSGTEPILRIMIEGEDNYIVNECIERISSVF